MLFCWRARAEIHWILKLVAFINNCTLWSGRELGLSFFLQISYFLHHLRDSKIWNNSVEYKHSYNLCVCEFNRGVQQQMRWSREKDQSPWRQGSGIYPIRKAKSKKNEDSLSELWENIQWANFSLYKGPRKRREKEAGRKLISRNNGWKLP